MTVALNSNQAMREIDFSSIPVSVIKSETRDILSALLDPPKIILTADEALPRDWRGLAHLTGISSAHVPSLMISDKPTATVIYRWSQKGIQVANIKKLQEFLQKIDRYDVLDDTLPFFESDALTYLNSHLASAPVLKCNTRNVTDNEIITRDDAHLALNENNQPQLYDAFVLYADEEVDFVIELVQRMEAYGFKLCLKDRDLLGGLSSQHAAIMKLIAERCHRLIIILSPAFVESPLNNFIVEFALIGGIKERTRKIIPCVYKSCEIQQSLSGYFLLFYRPDSLVNFWDKLRESLLLSPTERLALGERKNNIKALPPATPTITNTDKLEIKELPSTSNPSKLGQGNGHVESTRKARHASMSDLNQGNSENISMPSTLTERINSNPLLSDKPQKKNWYKKILKLGQSSSQKSKLKKNKYSKKPVLAD